VEFEHLSDDELIDSLDEGAVIAELENYDGWKIIEEAMKRTTQLAEKKLKDIDPTDASTIMQLQQIAKLYGDFIPNLIKSYKQQGELAFEEAKERRIDIG
jgi:hypothetical protein